MKIISCRVGQEAKVEDIGNDLKSMQKFVGGYIQAIYPYEDAVAVVCDEEGKLKGYPQNRLIVEARDIICGDFFICGLGEDGFTDIPRELEEHYLDHMNFWMV